MSLRGSLTQALSIGASKLRFSLRPHRTSVEQAQDLAFESFPDGIVVLDRDNRILCMNPAGEELLGCSTKESQGLPIVEFLPPLGALLGRWQGEQTLIVDPGGRRRQLEARVSPGRGSRESRTRLLTLTELTHARLAESLLASQTRVLERMASAAPLTHLLEDIVRLVEKHCPASFTCVMLPEPDGSLLKFAAGSSLPENCSVRTEGIPIGPEAPTPGVAAFCRERVVTADLPHDPSRGQSPEEAFRACWSTPVLTSDRQLQATLDLYFLEPRSPTVRDLEVIGIAVPCLKLALYGDASRKRSDSPPAADGATGRVEAG